MTVASDTERQDFLDAARFGELEELKELLEKYGPSLLNAKGSNGNSPLHMASANGHIDVVDFLLRIPKSIEINQANEAGNTALHWAALSGATEVAKLLLKAGADSSIKNSMGRTPFFEAKQASHEELADLLLDTLEESDNEE